MSDVQQRIAQAQRLLQEPLTVEFFEQTKEAIYDALERANELDPEQLRSICLMAKWRQKHIRFYQSFLETGKVLEFQEKTKPLGVSRFWKRKES